VDVKIGIDMDGVLADYVTAATALEAQGVNVFGHVSASESFWRELEPCDPLPWKTLGRLVAVDETYFITRRYGIRPQEQTASWLKSMSMNDGPGVIIVPTDKTKGVLAGALGLTAMVDDQPGVLEAVYRHAPACKGFLIDRPHNRGVSLRRSQQRVGSLAQALDALGIPRE